MKSEYTTEEKIYEAAKQVFLTKGLDGARMQEIADIAGINKALLHYYFRTKEKLYAEVVKNSASTFFPQIMATLLSELPFEVKIWTIVDKYINFLQQNPYVPHFILTSLNNNADAVLDIFHKQNLINIKDLQDIIDAESAKGNIKKVDARHFLLNFIGMCVFPFIAKPILKNIFKIEVVEYDVLIEERKKIIPQVLMAWMKV